MLRIITHAAGAEHVGGIESIPGAVLFHEFRRTGRRQNRARGFGHEAQPVPRAVVEHCVDARTWYAVFINGLRV